MGNIVYDYNGILYMNIVDNYKCTNACVFCNVELLEKHVGTTLYLKEKPPVEEVKRAIDATISKKGYKEAVFCGIGEPTIYLDDLLELTRYLKSKSLKVRLNTNGHGGIMHRDCARRLKDAGIDEVSVSLNATDEKEYDDIHRPVYPGAFRESIRFIKECLSEGISTTVSFIEHSGTDKIEDFMQHAGLEKAKIRFRKLIS